jgi:hypothetical protein
MIGLLTVMLYWWVWGSWSPGPGHFDETAYLVQARIFASGHFTAPGRPLPEFFEQLHVLVTPVLAAKYPPGHSILLAIGTLLHAPWFVPLLLAGLSGALVFALCARIGGTTIGILAWMIWLLAPLNLRYQPTFLSNVSTTTLWLAGWWALDEWWTHRRTRHLVLVTACVAWCLITRPLTGVAYLLPMAWVVVVRVRRDVLWRQFVPAAALGLSILSLLPLANHQITGKWNEMAWNSYARTYTPYDRLGFGFDSTPPLRLTSDTRSLLVPLGLVHRQYTLEALPRNAVSRAWGIFKATVGKGAPVLAVLAILGLIASPAKARPAFVATALLYVLHLSYAHPRSWYPYYLEAIPILAFVSALGVTGVASGYLGAWGAGGAVRRLMSVGTWAGMALWLVPAIGQIAKARTTRLKDRARYMTFDAALRRLPPEPSVVFVKKAPGRIANLIVNEPDLDHARIWVVQDRPDDQRLLAFAPGRKAYMYIERLGTLKLMTDSSPASPRP